jgi:hypothetical protein
VVHICNPSYSGGRGQEERPDLNKPITIKPISIKPNTKMSDGVTQGVGPEFKPQYPKKKNLNEGIRVAL